MSSDQIERVTPPVSWAEAEARLSGSNWLAAPVVQTVFSAFADKGEDCRAIGGAVRDTMLARPVNDLDFSTTATPDVAGQIMQEAGFAVHETGLAHGTITVARDGAAFEITTLRADVATDGRHASVDFTTDWSVDAARRDFTINAFSCDHAGKLFDPVSGFADLQAERIRFIGNAVTRIREDRLRILRFFRFSASYAHGEFDPDACAAIAEEKSGLTQLSAERIHGEIVRLLVAPRAVEVVAAMADLALFELLLGQPVDLGLFSTLVQLETEYAITPDPMRRLYALLAPLSPDGVDSIQARLRLSRQEAEVLKTIARAISTPAEGVSAMLYRFGAPAVRNAALLKAAAEKPRRRGLADRLASALAWQRPVFPLTGADLIAAGFSPGPALGVELARIEAAWIASEFTLTAAELRQIIRSENTD
ncbi:MAG: CCA tRNA nucleotidyltransferase [Pseudomonadota bacterium]